MCGAGTWPVRPAAGAGPGGAAGMTYRTLYRLYIENPVYPYIPVLHRHWARHPSFWDPTSVYPGIGCQYRVNIDPDIEEKPDIGGISGWQRVVNLNVVYRYRRFFIRYRVSRPDIGAISGWQRVSNLNIVYDIECFLFDIEAFSSISKFSPQYRCKIFDITHDIV